MSDNAEGAPERLRLAFDMFEFGVEMMRQNLRRAHPDARDDELELRLREWLWTRPGAEHGDAVGRLLPLPAWAQ